MLENESRTCNACQGSNLCYGYMGMRANSFVPSGIFTSAGYRVQAYACLDCGNIGYFLSREKLDRLKQRLKTHYS